MDYQDYLENFQHQIKEIVIQKLDRAFDAVNSYLQPTSTLCNELLMIEARFNQVKKEHQQGLITYDLYQTQCNKISLALINLVDKINYPDLKPQEDEAFVSNFEAYQKAQSSTPTPPVESAIVESTPIVEKSKLGSTALADDSTQKAAVSATSNFPKLESIYDFNLYIEQNRKLLTFYPVV